MRVPNLRTAPKRHLIKIRTFLKKIDSYLEKYKFARHFEGLTLDQISWNLSTAIKHLTNFRTTNLKLLLRIQILCASHFKFVWKYAPPWIRNTWISEFFLLFYIISTQTIYVHQKLHTLSRFVTLTAISNLFSFFYTPCITLSVWHVKTSIDTDFVAKIMLIIVWNICIA